MASTPILPFARWMSGTNQNSVPANDNSLRHQILNGLVISDSVTDQPGSPVDGDIYILPDAPIGAQWGVFDGDDLVIYMGGTWYAFAPVEGIVVNLPDSQMQYLGGSNGWIVMDGGAGSVAADDVSYDNGVSGLAATDVQTAIDELASAGPGGLTWNPQTASYTLVLSDANNGVAMNVASANTLTVPPNSSEAIPIGASILIEQEGAGLTTVAAGAGVTIVKRGSSLALGGQYALATLVKRGTDEWILSGDIAA